MSPQEMTLMRLYVFALTSLKKGYSKDKTLSLIIPNIRAKLINSFISYLLGNCSAVVLIFFVTLFPYGYGTLGATVGICLGIVITAIYYVCMGVYPNYRVRKIIIGTIDKVYTDPTLQKIVENLQKTFETENKE